MQILSYLCAVVGAGIAAFFGALWMHGDKLGIKRRRLVLGICVAGLLLVVAGILLTGWL